MSTIASRIDTVRLYRRGATVRRRVELGADRPAEIEIADLPLALWDPTAKVRVVAMDGPADSDVVASSVRIGLWAPPRETPPESPDAQAIRALETAIARDEAEIGALRLELSLLGGVSIPERPSPEEGRPPPRSPLGARLALEELVDDGVRTRTDAIVALEATLRTAREQLADARARRARASTAQHVSPGELRKTVIVGLTWSGAAAKAVTLELEYFVPGARWAPAYQCRLSRDGRDTSLTLRALVCQQSGEDWSAAKLELSTAAPLSWTEIPELPALRIGKAQAPTPMRRGFRPPPEGAAALLDDFDRDVARLARPAHHYARPQLLVTAPSAAHIPVSTHMPPGAGAAMESWADDGRTGEVASLASADMIGGYGAGATMAAPPPPPQAPAPRAAGRARAEMSRKGAPAPPMMKKARRAADMDDVADKEMMEDEGGMPDDPILEAVVFTSLRLRAPWASAERGRLVPVDAMTAYLQILGRSGAVVSGDAAQALAAAAHRAESAASVSMPRGALPLRDDRTSFDYAYRADAPVDVPSDGAYHSVPVSAHALGSEVAYVVVPREDTNVFRVATLRHTGDVPFLAGPVEVYVGDEYVLTTDLPNVPGGGQFQLGLGVEQAIKCARNTRYAESRSGDKVVATHELAHTIEIEVANNLDREIECEVRERIPQPARGAEVVVEEGAVSPKWTAYGQTERGHPVAGGRRWTIKVAGGGRAKLSAEYVVKIYANNEIAGGNRREA